MAMQRKAARRSQAAAADAGPRQVLEAFRDRKLLNDGLSTDVMLQGKLHMRERAPHFIFRYRPGIDGVLGQ
jgi:hypothetical protein